MSAGGSWRASSSATPAAGELVIARPPDSRPPELPATARDLVAAPRAKRRAALLRATLAQGQGALGLAIVLAWVVVAVFAPIIAPARPDTENLLAVLSAPASHGHLLGTDDLGRDILSRLLFGSRDSLIASAVGGASGCLFGAVVGMLAGFRGGVLEAAAMRVTDMLLAYPGLVIGLMTIAIVGPGLWQVCVAIAVMNVPVFARLGRSEVLREKELDYVAAARLQGSSSSIVLFRHILPNTFDSTLVQLGTAMGQAVMIEAALSFVGLGVEPPIPTWGGMLSESLPYLSTRPVFALSASVALVSLVLGINLLSDAFANASNPFKRQ